MKNNSRTDFVLAGILGAIGFAAVIIHIDIGGDYPDALPGPGLTLDEPFNVGQGVYLSRALGQFGATIFLPGNAATVFESDGYMSDYPPLGRLWLGVWHDITLRTFPVENQANRIVMSAARTGSAVAFGLLIWLVSLAGLRWNGRAAGLSAGLFLMLMPRVFGHAHLGSVETIMNLTWTMVVLGVLYYWVPGRTISNVGAILVGFLFGIAMLTKIQGVLLSVPITVWTLSHWRLRAIVPLALFGFAASITFVVLWPWLWFDPIPRSLEYLGRTTNRVILHTFYQGIRFRDVDVPWHYPFVMFAATMPVGILFAGCVGALHSLRWRPVAQTPPAAAEHARVQLLLLCAVFPMVIFAIPGVTVYDGIRLFLVACPMWALLAGHGVAKAMTWLSVRFKPRAIAVAVSVFVAAQAWGVFASSPLPLSYYNALVGGLAGAERLGFEVTYWDDCLTREFLSTIPNGATVYLAPVLHPGRPVSILDQNPSMNARNIQIHAFDYELDDEQGYLLLVHRRADLPPRWQQDQPELETVSELVHNGVPLARILKADPQKSKGY
jgi:hypothetical protein